MGERQGHAPRRDAVMALERLPRPPNLADSVNWGRWTAAARRRRSDAGCACVRCFLAILQGSLLGCWSVEPCLRVGRTRQLCKTGDDWLRSVRNHCFLGTRLLLRRVIGMIMFGV